MSNLTPEAEGTLREAEAVAATSRERLKIAAGLANEGLRALILLNGGALVALFTLLAHGGRDSFFGRAYQGTIIAAFVCWAVGLVLTAGAYVVGYWSQQSIAIEEIDNALTHFGRVSKTSWSTTTPSKHSNSLLVLAVGLAGLGIVAFIAGCGYATWAALASPPV